MSGQKWLSSLLSLRSKPPDHIANATILLLPRQGSPRKPGSLLIVVASILAVLQPVREHSSQNDLHGGHSRMLEVRCIPGQSCCRERFRVHE